MNYGADIFIAWSKETEAAAKALRGHLEAAGFSTWLSDEIQPGQMFRPQIRKNVLSSHIVVAVLPQTPSSWQIAESGLAYFEQKLFPVSVDGTDIIEPFNELQTHNIETDHLDGGGPSIDHLIEGLRARLGREESAGWQLSFYRSANKLFFHGVPLLGIAVVCALLVSGMMVPSDILQDHVPRSPNTSELWLAGHTVFGAIVYGGGAFVALLFSRVGTSASFSERRFGFHTARRLFRIWLFVAVAQLAVGLMVWRSSGLSISEHWLLASIAAYVGSLVFWISGYFQYSLAYTADKEQESLRKVQKIVFLGNLFFGLGITLITIVIVLMSLKDRANAILGILGS